MVAKYIVEYRMKGRFIVLYASNNLGKSKQLDLLEEAWQEIGRPYKRIKYPRYDSEFGRILNRELRGPVEERLNLTDEELQMLYAEDRRYYQPMLMEILKEKDVLAEDYTGTGLAWGLTKGVAREKLDTYNYGLLQPDLAILLDGERFGGGIEKGHRFEDAGQETWERNREIHRQLAAEFGWEVVEAGGDPQKIHERVLRVIAEKWKADLLFSDKI